MSNSSLVTINVPAKHYSEGRDGRKIEMITIHHMASVLSAEQCGKIFQGDRKASSHYGIGNNGEIGLYVDESNTAWANGNWDANCKAVTIETSNDKTGGDWTVGDKALSSLIKLVADIAKRNNLGTLVKGENLTWHRMYAATACPGEYLLSKMDYIIAEANKLNAETNETETGNVLYKVQVGAFSKKENAINYANELKEKGYDTYIVYIDNLYKVQVGAFSKEENAIKLMNELKSKGIDAFITTNTGKAVAVENSNVLTPGKAVTLNNTAIFVSSTTTRVAARKTGTYYLWDAEIINGRIRITNTKSNVGNVSQITGWINADNI